MRETRDRVGLVLNPTIKMPLRKQDLRDVPDEDVPIANAAVSPVPLPVAGLVEESHGMFELNGTSDLVANILHSGL